MVLITIKLLSDLRSSLTEKYFCFTEGVSPPSAATENQLGRRNFRRRKFYFCRTFTRKILLSLSGGIWKIREIFPNLFKNGQPEADNRGSQSSRLKRLEKTSTRSLINFKRLHLWQGKAEMGARLHLTFLPFLIALPSQKELFNQSLNQLLI